MEFLAGSLLELITQTSTNLPPDVRAAMSIAAEGRKRRARNPRRRSTLSLSNIDMAVDDAGPICQDTGMPTFVVHTPVGVNQIRIKKAILEAVAEATRLRQTAAQFGGFAHRKKQRQQPGRRNAGHSFRAVGRG